MSKLTFADLIMKGSRGGTSVISRSDVRVVKVQSAPDGSPGPLGAAAWGSTGSHMPKASEGTVAALQHTFHSRWTPVDLGG